MGFLGHDVEDLASLSMYGASTIRTIIVRVAHAIWNRMHETYLKIPSSENEWMIVADEFAANCFLPHCIGAIGRLFCQTT